MHLGLTLIVCLGVIYPVIHFYGAGSLWLAYLAIGIASLGSLLAFTLVFKAMEKSFKSFLTFVVGGMFSKMLAGIIAIVSLAMAVDKKTLFFFAVAFLLSYLVFTTLEVTSLMRRNKEVLEKEKEEKKITDDRHKNS